MKLKERNIDFSEPTRQSFVAIILILYKVYARFIKQFWYLIIPFFIGKGSKTDYLIYVFIGIAIILSIYSIFDFLRYKFHVKDNDFIVEKGVFSKKKIVIPFDRIQSINFKQNIIQQVFNVVGLEIDTAGTAKKEFDFDALEIRSSKALRDYIFDNKKEIKIDDNLYGRNLEIKAILAKKILNLNLSDLVKIGLTQNHFRSLFFALFSMFWIKEQIDKVGINIDQYADVSEENILKLGLYVMVGLLILSFILIIIISIIRNILKYYNLILKRIPNGFKLEYGLFNRNEISVMDNKMQVLKWNDNLLRKILGLFNLQIKLASSVAVKQRKSIIIPGVRSKDINEIKDYFFPDKSAKIDSFNKIDIYYLWRRIGFVISFFAVLPFLTFVTLNYFNNTIDIPIELYFLFSALTIYFSLTSYLKYNKMLYGFNNEVLEINSGIFGDKSTIFALYKLQGISITQSPIQVRKDLADLTIYSSAGIEKIKYIPKSNAEKIRDYILYKIETDKREWM